MALKRVMNNRDCRRAGFTLLELVIALAIMTVIVGACMSAFAFGPRSFTNQVNSLANQYRVRDVTRNVSRDARRTDLEDITVGAGYIVLGEITYTYSDESVYRNGTEITGGIKVFDYSLDGNRLTVEVESTENGSESFALTVDVYIRG